MSLFHMRPLNPQSGIVDSAQAVPTWGYVSVDRWPPPQPYPDSCQQEFGKCGSKDRPGLKLCPENQGDANFTQTDNQTL